MTKGRFSAKLLGVVKPVHTNTIVIIGTSKDKPKAKNRVKTKSRYLAMSVITATPSGAAAVKKPKTRGKTTK